MRVEHRRHGDQTGASENLTPRPCDGRCCAVWLGRPERHPHAGATPCPCKRCCSAPGLGARQHVAARVQWRSIPRPERPAGPCVPLSPGCGAGASKVPAIRVCSLHVFSFLSHVPPHTGPIHMAAPPHVSGIFPLTAFKPVLWEDPAVPARHQAAWLGPQRAPAPRLPLLGPCPAGRAWLHPDSISQTRHPLTSLLL